jgi:hypothetical protein
LRAIRSSGLPAIVLIVSHGCGCATGDVYWPTGTAAILQDRNAPRVFAEVPDEHRGMIKRRSLLIANCTPVTVLDDPTYRALSPSATRPESPIDPVRVRVTKGIDQGSEVIVRRQYLALPTGPNEKFTASLPIVFLILIATAAILWSLEKLVRTLKSRRAVNRGENPDHRPRREGMRPVARMGRDDDFTQKASLYKLVPPISGHFALTHFDGKHRCASFRLDFGPRK